MNNVTVACRLDVYNDITSTYQWHAYRRAGMLIGNTDTPPADGKHSATATAPFLTCKDVLVTYGPWVNYRYCAFSNHNASWPWVRVEAGENCAAYSNPRYGVPNDVDGNRVTSETHSHADVDQNNHLVEKPFNQLYGGGQGIYGQPTHAGVTTNSYVYTITYINNSKVLGVDYVEDNTSVFELKDSQVATSAATAAETAMGTGYAFSHWMNAGSTRIDSLDAGHTEDVVLYPSFVGVYTAIFVDQEGNVLAWDTFTKDNYNNIKTLGDNTKAPAVEDCTFDHWAVNTANDDGTVTVTELSGYDFTKTQDITIYPVYTFNGDVNLIPVDTTGDGVADEYQVGGYSNDTGSKLVEIPESFNGKPVTTINADAFSSYDDLHSVRIPGSITVINSQAFTANQGSQYNPKRDTVTLYYEGDPAVWKTAMEKYNADDYSGLLKENWDNNMGDGSRVFFLDANGKVDNTKYWELNDNWVWVLHEHAYSYDAAKNNCGHGEDSHYEYGGGIFGWGASLREDEFTDYAGNCDCSSCNNGPRPDASYWN